MRKKEEEKQSCRERRKIRKAYQVEEKEIMKIRKKIERATTYIMNTFCLLEKKTKQERGKKENVRKEEKKQTLYREKKRLE